jgi:hypothetical protein
MVPSRKAVAISLFMNRLLEWMVMKRVKTKLQPPANAMPARTSAIA